MALSTAAAVLCCVALVFAAAAQTRTPAAPAPGARPAAPGSRPAGSTRPGRAITDPDPPPPPPPEPEPREPATAPGGGWLAAAGLRLDAMQAAASEVGLDPAARIRVTDRIARARAEVNAAASRGETPAGARAADASLAQLDRDVQTAAKDAGPRLVARAAQIAAEVRELSRPNTTAFATLLEVLARPNAEQQARIREILGDAGRKAQQIELGPRDGLDQRRFAVGFAARAALRGVLAPVQLKNWDEMSGPRAGGGGGIGPASRPAAPDYAAEIEANYFTKLEAMRLAAEEGPYPADRKSKAKARVQKLKEDIAAAAAEPVKPKGEMTADKVDRLRLQCSRDLNDILGGAGYKDFDERVQRTVSQVLMLHNPERPLTSAFLSEIMGDLSLTPEQKAKIDHLLTERVAKLKQADKEAAGQPSSIQRMRTDQVAFATRAAIRQTLTPKQLTIWDQGG